MQGACGRMESAVTRNRARARVNHLYIPPSRAQHSLDWSWRSRTTQDQPGPARTSPAQSQDQPGLVLAFQDQPGPARTTQDRSGPGSVPGVPPHHTAVGSKLHLN
jgi:hypothetical protein